MASLGARRTVGRATLVGLLLLSLTGCKASVQAPAPMGTARFEWSSERRVQFASADIRVLDVLIRDLASGRTYARSLAGGRLVPTETGARLNFAAQALPTGTYTARVDAYVDDIKSKKVGSSQAGPFTVSDQAITRVQFPPLALAPTPVGQWATRVRVRIKDRKLRVLQATATLNGTDGTILTTPTWTDEETTLRWTNVRAYPSGLSTQSITVTVGIGTGSNRTTRSKLLVAAIEEGRTTKSSVQFDF